jgi:type IX secretion system PorP/SprF family membrane protein
LQIVLMNKKIRLKIAAILLVGLAINKDAKAQLNPMGSVYFQNQYLANPAFAGSHHGLDLNMGYRKQWTSIPGSPSMQVLTADYAISEKAGIGLNVYNDKAGLFKRTRSVASYAYHLPLSSENSQKLSFGLSLGVMNERISNEDINGDPNDVNVGNYNQRQAYVDGDFGIAFTSNKLNIQGALPNLKSMFKKDITTNSVDRSTFFSAISYKMQLSEGTMGVGLEPKLAYRGVKGFDNIIDAGANLSYADNKVNLFGMYHSSKSTTFGLGLNYQSIGISGMYSTATSALSNYANGNFEISMKIKILK